MNKSNRGAKLVMWITQLFAAGGVILLLAGNQGAPGWTIPLGGGLCADGCSYRLYYFW